jgi:hypothetical protein
MRIRSFVLPTSALALGAVLLTPTESVGWATIGGSLSTSQRDFRIFNNFSKNGANNNVTPDPSFPGYDGAELAIWKASIEWGSEKHGTGDGDPHQPGGLGSGKANFDAVFQGNATGVGNTNSNIHSQIGGSQGSTLAYTETPISDGWRIRYLEDPWNWKDGPNEIVGTGNSIDLQGVACHEYGHALGLGHSAIFAATMFASINGVGNEDRSINFDDKAGVQAVYGNIDPLIKPSITAVSGGVPLTITGFNFDASGNEVWFTQAGAGGNGTAVKATGVSSSAGGTQIVINSLPGNAGPGDIFVKISGNGNKRLSNAWPYDPTAVACGDVVNYCTPGSSASGCQATMSSTGTPSATAASGFSVIATGVEGAKDGLFFYGVNGQQTNSWGSGTSFQCIVPPVFRAGLLTGVGTAGACDGTFSQDLTALWTSNPLKNPGEAAQVEVQLWYRDPFNTSNQTTSLSDGISFSVCP